MKNGDLIQAKAATLPLIDHFGIAVVLDDGTQYVLHCVPFRGVVMDTLADFTAHRQIVDVQSTVLNGVHPGKIVAKAQEMENRPYDVLYFNCEHFVNYMLNEDVIGHQIAQYLPYVVLVCTILWLMFSRNHNSSNQSNRTTP